MSFSAETLPAEQLKIVIVGHVDHGKSTFVGRLFHDTGSLPEGKLEQLQKIAERRGVPFEWANLMDALQSERDQNITIDTAQIWFHTQKRQYVIIDAPGHKEILKNMVTGAANAEAALLLIDANEGVQEQSRRHGYLLNLLGIRQIAVLVNKMDLQDYSQARFDQIEKQYREFLASVGVVPKTFIPIAAKHGDNIASLSPRMPWWKGQTVLQALDDFKVSEPPMNQPLRFPIQDVYRFDDRRILAGRVESGRRPRRRPAHFQPDQQNEHGQNHRAMESSRRHVGWRRGIHRHHPHRTNLRRAGRGRRLGKQPALRVDPLQSPRFLARAGPLSGGPGLQNEARHAGD